MQALVKLTFELSGRNEAEVTLERLVWLIPVGIHFFVFPPKTGKLRPSFGGHRRPFAAAR